MNIRNSRWRWVIVAVVFLAAIVAGVVSSFTPSPNATLTNLNNVAELRDHFNRDKDKIRLVLLLSPT